jgi:hypothetical protein
MMREILKRVANLAVDVSQTIEVAADWEEWTAKQPSRVRTEKEKFLQRMLVEVYKDSRIEEVRK